MAPVETEYYELLGVTGEATDADLKKGYRRQAMIYHPDKNKSPDAEEKFKEISKAYQVLSDPNLRTVYDKHGKKMMEKEGAVGVDDAAGFFANVFGGERFQDYIGEISLMKEMTNVATTMMSDEERADLEREMNGGVASPSAPTPTPLTSTPHVHVHAPTEDGAQPSTPPPPAEPHTPAPPMASVRSSSPPSPSGGAGTSHVASASTPGADPTASPAGGKKRAAKMTPEQKKKLAELDDERRKTMEGRISALTAKLAERLRPFVDAARPGDKDDPETIAFQTRIQKEADDLKLESFGVELLHTIGTVYMMKASSSLKSRKFLGIPGFWSRLKEKGALAKDAIGVIGSALSVQSMVQEMEKLQAKGELGEEELRALEMDMTGKIMLASWRGTRFEVVQVLREVCDRVLKEPGTTDMVLYHRAKGMMLLGAIFKSTVPDETDEERRELERMVAEAAAGKSKREQLRTAAKLRADAEHHAGAGKAKSRPTSVHAPAPP